MAQSNPNNESSFLEIRIRSTLQDAKTPEARIIKDIRACGYDNDYTFAIKLALEEALINAVKHGNRGDETKQIVVRYAVNQDRAVITVRDDGPGFDPDQIPDPTSPDRLTLPDGRGIMLMRAYMDHVEYRDSGREVYMMKRRK